MPVRAKSKVLVPSMFSARRLLLRLKWEDLGSHILVALEPAHDNHHGEWIAFQNILRVAKTLYHQSDCVHLDIPQICVARLSRFL